MNVITNNGLSFIESSNFYSLAGFAVGNQFNTIDIPSNVMGKKVAQIYEGAFSTNKIIEAVNIPKTINNIASYAFLGCKNLKYLFFESGFEIINIQSQAFANCQLLTGLTILKPSMIHEKAFANCSNLRIVDGNFLKIEACAFENCEMLHTINLHSYVHIDPHAFDNCNHLSNIYLLKNVKGSFDFLQYLNPQTTVHCRADSKIADMAYEGYKIIADI